MDSWTGLRIRQWEGFRLAAYPDPASGADPWTIGYDHTGADLRPGLQISQAQAEAAKGQGDQPS